MNLAKNIKRFALGLLTIGLVSFSYGPTRSPIAQKVNEEYLEGLKLLVEEVRTLKSHSLAADFSLEALRNQFKEARLQYKQVEYLMAYSSHEFVNMHINGAPLKKLDKQEDAYVSILDPEGFQILDELIFGDESAEELKTIQEKIQHLSINLSRYRVFQRSSPLSDREIFEAFRQEVIRIFTLGVTGFDTPLSGHAMPEAESALKSLHRATQHYIPLIEKKSPELAKKLTASTSRAVTYVQDNSDFDSFDRMEFLKEYINPLYKLLLDAQLALDIETIYEFTNQVQSINYLEDNLFSEEFINTYYFTPSEAGQDHPKRQELGKMLFFDPVLSGNNERACASCHNADKAFTDGQAKSIALNFEGTILRNSPTLINSVYAERYFHDLRTERLETQMEHVIFDKKEFDTDFIELLAKLEKSEEYKDLFREAFPHLGKDAMTPLSVRQAIASYIKTLRGLGSPVDTYIRGEDETALTESQIRGFNLFMGKAACGTCHFAPIFNGSVPVRYHESESEVLGVPATTDTLNPEIDPDLGRYGNGRLKEQADIYLHAFKTPTVRNIGLTAPYMHNGVYETLEEVMAFYNKGGGEGLGIDVPNQTLPFDSLGLNTGEIQDIIRFMEGLNDTTGLTSVPSQLPKFPDEMNLNDRVIGGKY